MALRSMGTLGQPKIYSNLNPAAAIPVDREQIFRLRNFADTYRMNRGKEYGQYVPNSRFVFVTMMSGETLMHQRYRHPALSEGKPVLYAGEANFNNGKLQWWSNGSGNYRPDADHAAQSGLPMDQFYPYEDILKGMHAREKPREIRGFNIAGQRNLEPVQAKMMNGLQRPAAIQRLPGVAFPVFPSRF
jgi:hypothetical protein